MITVSQWVVFAKWAKERGYNLEKDTEKLIASFKQNVRFTSSLSAAWDAALPLLSDVKERIAVGVSSLGIQTFCNVFSKFSGKPYAYTISDFFDFSGSSTREVTGGEDGMHWWSDEENTGFRMPTLEELRFARFGGDPELKESSFRKNPYAIGVDAAEESFGTDYVFNDNGSVSRISSGNLGFRVACSLEEE
jgi:hypothetical protein